MEVAAIAIWHHIAHWVNINSGWLMVVITAIVGVITIAAIIFAPIIALRVQKNLDGIKDQSQRKLAIFKTLIATYAARTSPEHVQALNLLNIEFYGIEPVTS